MAIINISYAAASNVTMTLASLATDTNLLAGQESAAVDNSSNLYLDLILSGKITTGTSPTDVKEIRLYVVAELDDSNWPDVFSSTDAAKTVTTSGVRDALCKLAVVMATNSSSNVTSYFSGISVAALFGGTLPRKFVVFVTHNTGVNLNATGSNHQITVKGITETVV